jgi:Tol biopolymer transport system component
VAFTVHRFDQGSHEAKTDVFIKSLGNSSILTQITDTGTATKPTWSPDSKKIAYLDENDSGVKQIFIRVAAGGEPKTITSPM